MIPKRQLIVLALLEGLVMFSAMIRIALPQLGGINFESPPQLLWLVATLVLAGASVAHFVIRSAALARRTQAGEQLEDEQKQVFTVSIAVVVAAALLSLAGPQAIERLLG